MRFAITTLGCKVNQYDSAVIESRLAARGLERRQFDQAADVYIINTCTVTDRADAESLRLVRRARRLNPNARVVVTGCFAQASPGLLARHREIDAIVGLGQLDQLERAALGASRGRVIVSNLRRERAPIEFRGVALAGHSRAFLKVQEGCDQFCSFCIVPISRGASRSVEPRKIIEIIDELHCRGFKEVILSGVHLGGYGRDLDPPVDLAAALEMISERSPISRVRISSLDPEELDDRIIATVARSDKLCPHLHLPLQSGSDEILWRMRRRYTTAYYRERVEQVLSLMPDAAIGTDIIVGFPGETEALFEASRAFVERLPLAYFHVFPYSVRTGTTAAKMADRVEPAAIRRRAALMRELGERKREAFARRLVGSKLKILLEEYAQHGILEGYSRNYVRVSTPACCELRNQEVEVEISVVQGAHLAGEIVQLREGAAVCA